MALHSDREYEAELQQLRAALSELGEHAGSALASSLGALSGARMARGKAPRASVAHLHGHSQTIDRLCVRILALRQPTASDLRFVVVALKANLLFNRIGSLSQRIAARAKDEATLPSPEAIADLARQLQSAFDLAKEALVEESRGSATRTHSAGRKVAALERKLFGSLRGETSHTTRVLDTIADIAEAADALADLVPFLLGGRAANTRPNDW
jgi:phosphate transport system protein